MQWFNLLSHRASTDFCTFKGSPSRADLLQGSGWAGQRVCESLRFGSPGHHCWHLEITGLFLPLGRALRASSCRQRCRVGMRAWQTQGDIRSSDAATALSFPPGSGVTCPESPGSTPVCAPSWPSVSSGGLSARRSTAPCLLQAGVPSPGRRRSGARGERRTR